jgi:hypothetical protein
VHVVWRCRHPNRGGHAGERVSAGRHVIPGGCKGAGVFSTSLGPGLSCVQHLVWQEMSCMRAAVDVDRAGARRDAAMEHCGACV